MNHIVPIKFHRWYFAIFFLFCIGIIPKAWADVPKVVVSLKPIHSLVSAIMQGVGEPNLLIAPTQSPHTFQLKPSQIQKIQEADLIVWVGPNLETALAKPLQSISSETQIVEIGKLPQLNLLPMRDDCNHDGPCHHIDDLDLHVWLDPIMMKDIVEAIILRLTQVDPIHALRYRENGLIVQQMLDRLNKDLQYQLEPIRDKQYIVYHDSGQYFEKRYGLQAPVIMALSHHHTPSIKKMNELKEQIELRDIQCIFVEPQLPIRQATTLAEMTKISIATLDPLGIMEPEGPDLYPAMIRTLAKTMVDCLTSKKE